MYCLGTPACWARHADEGRALEGTGLSGGGGGRGGGLRCRPLPTSVMSHGASYHLLPACDVHIGSLFAKGKLKTNFACSLLSLSADVLLKLDQQRGFEMFVHPVAPVLSETRHVVAPFNHKLKQEVILLAPYSCAASTLYLVLMCPVLSRSSHVCQVAPLCSQALSLAIAGCYSSKLVATCPG